MIQITPFQDVELHKLYIYLSFVIKKLPKDLSEKVDLSDEVALEYYTNKKIFEGSLSLDPGDSGEPLTPAQHAGSWKKEEEKEELSSIIERLNQRFGTEFTKSDMLSVEQIKEDFAQDEDLVQKAKTNNIDDFKYAFTKAFMDKVVDRMGNNEQFFTRILDDEEFRDTLMQYMMADTYEKLREESALS